MDVATETDAIVDARDATLGDIGAALEAGSDVAVFDSTSDDADANRVVTADDARSSDSGASEPAQDAATVFDANGTDANTRDAEMTADAGRPPPAGMLCSVDRVCTASARRPALWAMASVVLIASRLRRKRAKSA